MSTTSTSTKVATRALIVEDDANMARAIQRVLRGAGFDTAVADSGFEAGVLLMQYQPQFITLDLQMPGMNGQEVLDCLRSTESLWDIKVLIISGLPLDELRAMLDQGADDILHKPFDNRTLLEKVTQLAGK